VIATDKQLIMFPDITERERLQLEEAARAFKEFADQIEEPKMKADDRQVSGSHYKELGVQPWAVMEAVLTPDEFIGYLKGSIIKYSMRQGKKADSDDGGKAKHYIQKLSEVTNG
jgi:Protein of unknwon function (DUF3310)